MCRLLGWAGATATTVQDAVGDAEVHAFEALSLQHKDGWGMAWWDGTGDAPVAERSTETAAHDPRFAATVRRAHSDAGFAHIRWATPGFPVVPENTHPFVQGQWAFAHNGAIHPQERLHELVPADDAARLHGRTDSELYFAAILAEMRRGASPVAALDGVVRRILERFESTSLNAMLLGPDALYVVNAYDAVRPVTYGGQRDPRAVYDLHLRRRQGVTVVASSGVQQPSSSRWEPVENMTVLRVARHTLELSSHHISAAVPLSSR